MLKKRTRIIYSPFREMIASLHVLQNPAHHLDRQLWAEEVMNSLPETLVNQLIYFGRVSNDWLNFLDLDDYLQFQEKYIEEAIERLALMEDAAFISFLLGERKDTVPSERSREEQEVFIQTTSVKKQLCECLYDYVEMIFARELFRIEPWLKKAVSELEEEFQKHPMKALDSIHPRFKVENDCVKFYKAETWMYKYEEFTTLTIYPSTFVAPHLLVGLELPHLIVYLHVSFPNERISDEEVPMDLMKVLKALADEKRIIILRKLLYHPYCTQQLTEVTDLAKATISAHLKVLEKSGLITSQRRGHFVFYQANSYALNQLRVDLDQFFDEPALKNK
ncbi:ArsR/SmtB family transcription factor [Bacillus massilioanorexius]|nr:metalloregulator ArsR/SmtB family transcription factor [Bacillus massilioanorexius]